jgi:hypothetical protein
MTKPFITVVCLLLLGALGSSANQSGTDIPKDLIGTWSGGWEGMGQSGGFELILEKGKEGGTGRVAVTGEPTYKATIRTMSFEGKKMTAVYDFPPDEQIEVVLNTTFEGDSATGPWIARLKQDKSEVASGTLKLTKK